MPFHLYKVRNEGEGPHWLGIHVEYEEDHWVSTCMTVDRDGNEVAERGPVAPKFYGVTAEQACRRMVDVLENTYDEVIPASEGT